MTGSEGLPSSGRVLVTMNGDWRVGTGAGRPGDADRVVRRDEDDLPFVPAKTLLGVWRDATETLADALGGRWPEAVALVFGSEPTRERDVIPAGPPIPAALTVRPARLREPLRSRLVGEGPSALLRAATVRTKAGVSIDDASGRARDEHLRFDELVRGETILEAPYAVDEARLPAGERDRLLALLTAGASFVERLGADRRRGSGLASLQVGAVSDVGSLRHLLGDEPVTLSIPELEGDRVPAAHGSAGGPWSRIRLTFTLQSPVLAGATTTGNIVRTLDFLPGAYILGALGGLLDRGTVASAVRAGDLLATPATISVEGSPGRPMPFCLRQVKDASSFDVGTVRNAFHDPYDKEEQTKELRAGYLGATPLTGLPVRDSVSRVVETHGTIDEEVQRPTARVGGVYSYEAIKAGQQLVAELRVRGDHLDPAGDLAVALDGASVRLGRSKKDDYGAATLRAQLIKGTGAPEDSGPELLEGIGAAEDGGPELLEECTLWLLSDMLCFDDAQRPDPSVRGVLRELGRSLATQVMLTPDSDLPTAAIRTRRTDSWHQGWGLPRTSHVAVQAGSCARLRFARPVKRTDLDALELAGVGARRAEGYGQVCFDDRLLASGFRGREFNENGDRAAIEEPQRLENGATAPAPTPPLIQGDDALFARSVEEAAWKAETMRLAALVSAHPTKRYTALGLDPTDPARPRTSQLSALRSAVLRLDDEAGAVVTWLEGLTARTARTELWPPGALAEIRRLCVTQPDAVWRVLGEQYGTTLEDPRFTLTRTPGQMRKATWTRALQALVDECVRAVVRQREVS